MPIRAILDTDIGTDIDDCLALALILASPEIALEGITCVYGDVGLRAQIALKLLALRGRTDVPVMVGLEKPLLGLRPIYWEGHEGDGILAAGDDTKYRPASEYAPDFIARIVTENPGQIHLIAIAPLTNIAMAFLREPKLAQNLTHLTIMGGVARGLNRLDLPYAEHNIVSDAEAAHIVFSSGAPISVVPLDITTLVRVDQDGLARVQAAGTPFHAAVTDQLGRYPRFQSQGWTNLHDPLAVGSVIDDTFLTWQPIQVEVETSGRVSAGATWFRAVKEGETSNVRVAVGVNAARFERFFIERLEQP
jgi:purine nucleosidase